MTLCQWKIARTYRCCMHIDGTLFTLYSNSNSYQFYMYADIHHFNKRQRAPYNVGRSGQQVSFFLWFPGGTWAHLDVWLSPFSRSCIWSSVTCRLGLNKHSLTYHVGRERESTVSMTIWPITYINPRDMHTCQYLPLSFWGVLTAL